MVFCSNLGRAIARIFHSISSPKYTAFEWSTNEYWGKFTHVNFNDISRKATKALDMYHQKMNGLTAS
jgi:hypothetical protein